MTPRSLLVRCQSIASRLSDGNHPERSCAPGGLSDFLPPNEVLQREQDPSPAKPEGSAPEGEHSLTRESPFARGVLRTGTRLIVEPYWFWTAWSRFKIRPVRKKDGCVTLLSRRSCASLLPSIQGFA